MRSNNDNYTNSNHQDISNSKNNIYYQLKNLLQSTRKSKTEEDAYNYMNDKKYNHYIDKKFDLLKLQNPEMIYVENFDSFNIEECRYRLDPGVDNENRRMGMAIRLRGNKKFIPIFYNTYDEITCSCPINYVDYLTNKQLYCLMYFLTCPEGKTVYNWIFEKYIEERKNVYSKRIDNDKTMNNFLKESSELFMKDDYIVISSDVPSNIEYVIYKYENEYNSGITIDRAITMGFAVKYKESNKINIIYYHSDSGQSDGRRYCKTTNLSNEDINSIVQIIERDSLAKRIFDAYMENKDKNYALYNGSTDCTIYANNYTSKNSKAL